MSSGVEYSNIDNNIIVSKFKYMSENSPNYPQYVNWVLQTEARMLTDLPNFTDSSNSQYMLSDIWNHISYWRNNMNEQNYMEEQNYIKLHTNTWIFLQNNEARERIENWLNSLDN